MIRSLVMRSAMAVLALATVVAWSATASAASDPWAKGAQWMSIRAGYAKAAGDDAANGGAGYGFGYSRMLNKRWAVGLYAHHEVMNKSGDAAAMAFPFTVELVRHGKWRTALHPYLGAGFGGFHYRTYRTGDDSLRPSTGYYLVTGLNTPVSTQQVLGLDLRLGAMSGDEERIDPTFGEQKKSFMHYGLKLNWAFTY